MSEPGIVLEEGDEEQFTIEFNWGGNSEQHYTNVEALSVEFNGIDTLVYYGEGQITDEVINIT